MTYYDPIDVRDKLIGLIQDDPLITEPFPNGILKFDPGNIDESRGTDLCIVPIAVNWGTQSLGKAGVGKWQFIYSYAVLGYAYSGHPTLQNTALDMIVRATFNALRAIFKHEAGMPSGDRVWYRMTLPGGDETMQSKVQVAERYFRTETVLTLRGVTTK